MTDPLRDKLIEVGAQTLCEKSKGMTACRAHGLFLSFDGTCGIGREHAENVIDAVLPLIRADERERIADDLERRADTRARWTLTCAHVCIPLSRDDPQRARWKRKQGNLWGQERALLAAAQAIRGGGDE